MCGFSGFILKFYLPNDVGLSALNVMANSLLHRGPDANDVWFDADSGVGLAHVRLSILELSEAGAQPMHSANNRFVISFNGEIYNHLDLRTQLEKEVCKIVWRGNSDTETLLECIAVWGLKKTLQATVGMFAFALWDRQENELVLARDRLGEKPLYWGWCGDVLLFGSELKALKAHPGFNAAIDRNSLALLMRYNSIPAPYSIYEGIEKLKAGYFVRIKKGQKRSDVSPESYWSFKDVVETGIASPFKGDVVQTVDALENVLNQSVAGQMLADVSLGAFLSGGIDSSTIVALMQKQSSSPVQTFAIGFDEPGYNEAVYAKEVAAHLGTNHTEYYVSAKDALAVVPKLPHIYSEPFADSSQIPTFLVNQMAKQQVTVALSGDAGDELFGGYTPYQFAPKIWNAISKLPLSIRKAVASLLGGLPMPDKLLKLLNVLPSKDRAEFYHILMTHWQQPEQLVLGAKPYPTVFDIPSQQPNTDCFEHWMMAMDASQYMIDDILVKVDRAAMANSLEVRVPMLDHRVVEFAWTLPLTMKIRDGKGKWVLREVLYRHVPKHLIERPKKGFSIPLAQWLRGPLKEWAETLLSETRLRNDGYFNVQMVRQTWHQHLQGKRDHALKLWGVLMFQAWLEVQ
ncbi:asparagine synthase (glutamine-hydrolyzing) [Denitrificimonas caeni]|uniref:asparagine synthase (glutamine-hydrolyzing) n=1 Tax=Denitrificimonas caeni TaxID=521720 RepID=UPI0003B48C67|nr:asparagine synthase (glutamine-hydrolyzing) [Denitrificimonas caeni]